MDNYKYDGDQMRPKLIEMLYKVRREAAKYRDFCDLDMWIAKNAHKNSTYFEKESDKYDEIIDILR